MQQPEDDLLPVFGYLITDPDLLSQQLFVSLLCILPGSSVLLRLISPVLLHVHIRSDDQEHCMLTNQSHTDSDEVLRLQNNVQI